MTKISVPDMHCAHCVSRITDALRGAGLTFTVSLDEKCVLIDGGEPCVKTAVTGLEDLGFTPAL